MEVFLALLKDGLLAAIAAIGFAVISDPPKKTIPFAALLAALGHTARYAVTHYAGLDLMTGSFIGALVIGFACLGFAYWLHCPTTTLYIPALLPMIPGMYAYRTIFAITQFMQNTADHELAMGYMLEVFTNSMVTFAVVFALGLGASLPTQMLRRWCFQMTRENKEGFDDIERFQERSTIFLQRSLRGLKGMRRKGGK